MVACDYCGDAAKLVTGKAIYPHRLRPCEHCDAALSKDAAP